MPRKSLIIIALVATVGLVGILWFINRGDRSDRFARAVTHLSSVRSYEAGVALDFLYGADSDEPVPMRLRGLVNMGRAPDGSLLAQADLTVDAGDPATEVMALAARLPDDGTLYSMVDGLPEDLGEVLDVEGLNGAWFSLSDEALAMLLPWSAGGGDVPAGAAPDGGGALLLQGKRFDDTVLEGVPVAHYEAFVDRAALVGALADLSGELRGVPPADTEVSAIADYVADRDFLAETWIDKRHDRFFLIKVITVPVEGISGSPVALTVKFTGFDQDVSVDAPEGARPLSAVLANLLRVPAASVEAD